MENIKPYTKYKPSGIAWLGDIPEHWEVSKAKYILSQKKKTLNPELNCGSISFGKIVYKDNERVPLETKATYQELLNGEFLINPLNLNFDLKSLRTGLSTIDVVVSTGYIVLQNNPSFNKRYLRWLLHQFDVSFMKTLGDGVRQILSYSDFKNTYLLYILYEEQEKNANFIDYKTAKIDRFIAKKKQLIKLLNEQKSAIINDAVTKGLNPNVKMKPSGIEWLGDIPEHWEVRKLSTIIISAELGGNYDSSEVSDGIPVLKMGNLDRSFIKLSRIEYLKKDSFYEARHILNYGDFLFNTRNSADLVGKVGLWRNELPLSLYNSNILRISFKLEVNNEFMNYLFNSHAILNFLKLIAKGTTNVSAIYYKDLSKIDIWLPNIFEQKDIVSYIEQETTIINTTISTIEKEISLVEEYKTALIAEAVTGKIDVRDYEIAEASIVSMYQDLEEEMSLVAEEEIEYETE